MCLYEMFPPLHVLHLLDVLAIIMFAVNVVEDKHVLDEKKRTQS